MKQIIYQTQQIPKIKLKIKVHKTKRVINNKKHLIKLGTLHKTRHKILILPPRIIFLRQQILHPINLSSKMYLLKITKLTLITQTLQHLLINHNNQTWLPTLLLKPILNNKQIIRAQIYKLILQIIIQKIPRILSWVYILMALYPLIKIKFLFKQYLKI